MSDAKVYDAIDRLDYISHWDEKTRELEEKMKKTSATYTTSIQEELNLFAEIRRSIDELTATLGDMNALTRDEHVDNNFEQIFQTILDDIRKQK